MNGTKTLEMVFNLDNGKELTISLTSPKDDITAEQISNIMDTMVAKSIIVYNGALLESSKTAYVKEVEKNVLF